MSQDTPYDLSLDASNYFNLTGQTPSTIPNWGSNFGLGSYNITPYDNAAQRMAKRLNTGEVSTNMALNNSGDGINWFGKNGVIGNAAMGLEALSGLANAYTGYKAYKLAKQQFGFQKALANRNLMNQAKIINNTYDNAAQVASGMIGSRNADGTYGFTDPNVTKRYEDKAKTQHVNGSAI